MVAGEQAQRTQAWQNWTSYLSDVDKEEMFPHSDPNIPFATCSSLES